MPIHTVERPLLTTAMGLVARYRWQTITPADLTERVQARCEGMLSPAAEDLDQLCKQEASALLLAACRAAGPLAGGTKLRESAYTDLSVYLNTLAGYLTLPPGVSGADVVQETLLIIYQTLHTCREPQTFLAWAATILRRQAARQWRTTPAPAHSIELLEDHAEALVTAHPAQDRQVDPAGDQDLLRLLHRCLDTDEERLWALCMMFGLKRRELHMLLDAPPAHLDTLAQRVRRKLRASDEFRAFLDQ